MPGAARYRLRQFGAALVARVQPDERRLTKRRFDFNRIHIR